jgi:hypothetical protein
LNKVEIDSKQLQLESAFFKEFIQNYYTQSLLQIKNLQKTQAEMNLTIELLQRQVQQMTQEVEYQGSYGRKRVEMIEIQISNIYQYGSIAIGVLVLINLILLCITLQGRNRAAESKESSPRGDANHSSKLSSSSPKTVKRRINDCSDSFH